MLILPFFEELSWYWPVIRVVCVSYTSCINAWFTGKLIEESLAEKTRDEGGKIGVSRSLLEHASKAPPKQIVDISNRLLFIKLALTSGNFQAKKST
jgi:hypothetical protein